MLARLTFLKAIGIYTDEIKKSLLLRNFFIGNKTMSLEDNNNSKQIMEKAEVQEEFCKFMKHTGLLIKTLVLCSLEVGI